MSVKVILRIFLLSFVFIQITGIAGALSLAEIGKCATPGWTYDVAVSGNYAYVVDGSKGLMSIDITNPKAPTLAGSYDTAGSAYNVAVSGNYAYVGDQNNGLVIIDISNPITPTLAGGYDTAGGAGYVAVSGNYAYVADHKNGLVIIDISNPKTPTLAGSYGTTESVLDVAVSGNYAYVADGDNGLVVVDISNPKAPTLAGNYDASGRAVDVAISGNYAYVVTRINGFVIIDISNPATPTLVGSHDIDKNADDIAVSGNYAYVADSYNGLVVFDISNPASPKLVGSYDVGGQAGGVEVSGNYAYVAVWGGGRGLFILGDLGSISTSSNPSGANVYLDGAYKGTTPYTITSVSAGSHTIKLAKYEYEEVTKNVNVIGGGTAHVLETLVPLTGSISVSSNPPGARVYLDGVYKGTTPLTIEDIFIARHLLKLVKDGYKDQTESITITGNNRETVSMSLEPSVNSAGIVAILLLLFGIAIMAMSRKKRRKKGNL